LIALFTAIATPAADVLSMFLLALPMVALYFLAVAVSSLHDRRKKRRQLEAESVDMVEASTGLTQL
jgi:sec-independent protein translocase protein TatC